MNPLLIFLVFVFIFFFPATLGSELGRWRVEEERKPEQDDSLMTLAIASIVMCICVVAEAIAEGGKMVQFFWQLLRLPFRLYAYTRDSQTVTGSFLGNINR